MSEKLPYVDTPEPTAVLWRYMDFTKFMSMLDSSTLNFTRIDSLNDYSKGDYPSRLRSSRASSKISGDEFADRNGERLC